MTELQEIRTNAMSLEKQLLDVAAGVPQLHELLGPHFFDPQPTVLLGEYLQQLGERIERVRVALINVKFWEEYPWPEAMLKLLSNP